MTDRYKTGKIVLREYQSTHIKGITLLFYDTVHMVNTKDYSKEQLDVWAGKDINLAA